MASITEFFLGKRGCPHCGVHIHLDMQSQDLGKDFEKTFIANWGNCPNCRKMIVSLYQKFQTPKVQANTWEEKESIVYPEKKFRHSLSPDVPKSFSEDYNEASLVLNVSPKASAALSRRCLQNMLREKAHVTKGNLSDEIQEILDSKQLPTYLATPLDAIRHIGNFGSHPVKSTNTGEILEVEPGEAEWLLSILEGLFDFYFVQPQKMEVRRNELNEKLREAGKPPMKEPGP